MRAKHGLDNILVRFRRQTGIRNLTALLGKALPQGFNSFFPLQHQPIEVLAEGAGKLQYQLRPLIKRFPQLGDALALRRKQIGAAGRELNLTQIF